MLELKTKINIDGIKQGLTELKAKIKDAANGITNWGKVYSDACARGNSSLAKLAKQALETEDAIEKQKTKIAELKKEYEDLNDGTLTEGEKKFVDELNNTNSEIAKQEEQMYAYYARLDELQANAFKAPDEEGEVYLAGDDKAEFDKIQQELNELEPSLERNKEKVDELFVAWSKYTAERKNAIESELDSSQKQESELEQRLAQLREGIPNTFNKIGTVFKGLMGKIGKLAARALVFNVISKALRAISKLLQGMLLSNDDFKKDFEELKAALYAIVVPIVDVIRPAIQWIVAKIRDWAVSIGKIGAAMKGMTYSEYVQQAKASKEAADNYEDMADSSERMLASFDNIEILDSGNDDSSSEYSGYDSLEQYDTGEDESKLASFAKVVAGALIAIGVILLFKGLIPLGIGLIAAGAATEGIVNATTDDGQEMDRVSEQLSALMLLVSAAMITIGVILCFCGVIPKGIGFIISGAATLIADIVLNWDEIVETVKGIFKSIGDFIEKHGYLVIGIILCLGGFVTLPFGLCFIYKWAEKNAEEIPLAGAIVEFVEGIWEDVTAFWNKWIAPVFTKGFWVNLAKKCGNGLIEGFENAVNGIITLFEKMLNFVIGGLNKISFSIPDWAWLGDLAGKKFGINISEAKLGRVSIPRLAQGAVIPANREFLAVLGDQKQGTNIETPLATMIEAFTAALDMYRGGAETTVVLEMDGREFGRTVVNAFERESSRKGIRFVTI